MSDPASADPSMPGPGRSDGQSANSVPDPSNRPDFSPPPNVVSGAGASPPVGPTEGGGDGAEDADPAGPTGAQPNRRRRRGSRGGRSRNRSGSVGTEGSTSSGRGVVAAAGGAASEPGRRPAPARNPGRRPAPRKLPARSPAAVGSSDPPGLSVGSSDPPGLSVGSSDPPGFVGLRSSDSGLRRVGPGRFVASGRRV